MDKIDKIDIVANNYATKDIEIEHSKILRDIYISGFKRGVEVQKNTFGWISTTRVAPPVRDIVQLLIVDDSCDNPYMYTGAGFYIRDDIYVVDNDVVNGDVIAWQPLAEVPSKEMIKLITGDNNVRV